MLKELLRNVQMNNFSQIYEGEHMNRLTIEELLAVKQDRSKAEHKDQINIGFSTCGIAAGAQEVLDTLREEVKKRNLTIPIKTSGCIGKCYAEPLVEVRVGGMPRVYYGKVDKKVATQIVEEHICKKKLINDHIYESDPIAKKVVFVQDTDTGKKKRLRDFCSAFAEGLKNANLADEVEIVRVADIGVYNKGIVVRVFPGDFMYCGINDQNIKQIIKKSIVENKKIDSYSHEFSSKQFRIVLRNCGVIDPEEIDDYLAHDGYQALAKVLKWNDPQKVIEEIERGGLRGRGGAGFPTAFKWKFSHDTEAEQKYIICNADEGDPGAYMDRSVLEGDPHSVIEGMIIGGYVIGATKGFFYVRAEYPLAIDHIHTAIKQARARGLLGENILGTSVSFDIEVRLGAGAFVCGEETALIASVEGDRGYPRPRPPYPSVKGLWGNPTVINNVETLANVPVLINKGGQWFSEIGTKTSKGTKVFSLTGKVKNSCLLEVPMGITIEEIISEIGGGLIDNKKVKAVQTGGPSGGVIPKEFHNTPVGYESLQKLGSIMGSGGMIAMSEDDCMVDIAKFYLQFCVDESCGKCAPCRLGGPQMLSLLEKISEGKGVIEDIDKLRKTSVVMKDASLCGLGQTAPNPVLSTLKYFEEEYKSHVVDRKCLAGKCKELVTYSIDTEKCTHCGLCKRECPVDSIFGDKKIDFEIDGERCIRCGRCFEICKFGAVVRY